ncbi:hypothetical protein [Parachitinimonas caeni]|uniref:Uncharacterized protein n=1 Tax=Parachitinimonas caeni TaxID=3031301 RepID=A0ABT7E0T8_9NEIS|nr:hypothetical protein [Parachitinimonas caeni]MDK2125923.1 hypothetical protein [Parachitinimonas caeni]
MKSTLVLTAMIMGLAGTAANATDFLLHNETGHRLISFVTKEKGERWSPNWITTRGGIKGGETWHMDFNTNGKDCKVDIKIKSDDGYVHDFRIDFCKASEIFVMTDSIEYR